MWLLLSDEQEGYPRSAIGVRLTFPGRGIPLPVFLGPIRFSFNSTPTSRGEIAVERNAITRYSPLKLIIAIVQPSRLEAVKEALSEVEVFRLTVVDCQGFGRQKGQAASYRGPEFAVNLLRKVQLQIAVNEEFVEPTIQAILKGAKTSEKGQIGDGKIFILPMDDCIRIRTGERGTEAI